LTYDNPAVAVLAALRAFPTGEPQREALADLQLAADVLREQGRFFAAGYGMAHGVHLAWGDGEASDRCVRQAFADYERAVADPQGNELDAIAALVSWTALVGMNYIGEDPTGVRQTDLALDQVLSERLIQLGNQGVSAQERHGYLIRGFHLTTDFKGDWRVDFPEVAVRRGTTTSDGSSVTLRIPSAFSVLVGAGDYAAAQSLADACPDAFTSAELRGWRAATAGFTRPDEAMELFSEAADYFARDTYEERQLSPEGWSSINVDLWAKYFRARAAIAGIIRSPERAAELISEAHQALLGTESGWANPQVTCFRVVVDVLNNLFAQAPGDLSSAPRQHLLLAARISGLDESSEQAFLFLDEIAGAYEELRTDPPSALVSGRLPAALRVLGRIPLVGQEVATAITAAVGERAHRTLLGQELTWIHRTFESIRDEDVLRRVLLRLLQASPPRYAQLRHGPIEYGKDIVVLSEEETEIVLTMYAVKVGDISKQKWPAAQQQLQEIFQVPLPDVQLPIEPTRREAVLAFNGHLNPYAEPAVRGWLDEQESVHGRSIQLMHLDELVSWIIDARLVNELRAAFTEFGATIVEM
jgi:hypothetical protein